MKCQFCSAPSKYTSLRLCDSGVCSGKYHEAKRAQNMEAGKDPRVAAIRADAAVGRGSCSSIDECYEDTELVSALDRESIQTAHDAVRWARATDGLHWESGLNQMSGEPETDDPIREMYEESKARNALPIAVAETPAPVDFGAEVRAWEDDAEWERKGGL